MVEEARRIMIEKTKFKEFLWQGTMFEAMEKATSETVHNKSDDEIINNFEDETWKLTGGRYRSHDSVLHTNYDDFLCYYGKSLPRWKFFQPNPAKLLNDLVDKEPGRRANILLDEPNPAKLLNDKEPGRRATEGLRELHIGFLGKLYVPSNGWFDETEKICVDKTPNHSIGKASAMDSADFTAVDISFVSPQSGKTDMEMKNTQPEHGTSRAKDEAKSAFQWWNKPSQLKNTWPNLKTEDEYFPNYGLHRSLLLTLLSMINFLTALNIMGCKSEEGYKNNSSLNSICQIVNQYPDFVQLVVAFNTVALFSSVACMLIIFNMLETAKISLDKTPNHSIGKASAMDSADFTAVDISFVSPQSEKTDMEIKNTQLEHGTSRAKDEAKSAFQCWNKLSHLKNTWPNLKTENEYSPNHVLHLLLLLTLLSMITFLTALKIMGCKSEEGYKHNSSLNSICQIVNQYPDFVQLVVAFNTVAFFFFVAWMVIIFNKLPLRPLLLVSSFSMLGAYICIISAPSKLPLSSFYSKFYESLKIT